MLLLFTSFAAGQEASPLKEKYTLAELVGLALKDAPLLGAQDARVEAKRLSAEQARAWPGISTDFLAGRRSEGGDSGPRFGISLAQPLPLTRKPGLRGGLFDLEAEAAGVHRSAAEVFVTISVAKGAYEYAANRRKAAFAERRRKRFELIQSYLSGRVFPTPQRKAESRIVANRVKNVAAEAIRNEAGYKASLEKLRTYLPLDAGKYPEVEVPWLSGNLSMDEKAWLEKALRNNPDLRVQRIDVQAAQLERTLASREGLPDASVIASYEQGKAAQTERNSGLGLSLAFPSWNRNRSGIRSAEQRRLAEERALAFEEQKIKAEVPRALIEYEAARQVALKYPQDLLDQIEVQLQDADAGFRKGQVDLLTFLELDGSASETYSLTLDAQTELATKATELLELTNDGDALKQLGAL